MRHFGAGLIEKRVKVINDAIAIQPMAYISFTLDHRILDGATADYFVAEIKNDSTEKRYRNPKVQLFVSTGFMPYWVKVELFSVDSRHGSNKFFAVSFSRSQKRILLKE